MSGTLTEPVRIYELAARSTVVDEFLDFSDLPRLAAILAPEKVEDGNVRVELVVFRADESVAVRGHLEAALGLQCQRCLCPMLFRVDHDFCWMLSETETRPGTLPSEFEPILLEDCRAEGIARGEGRDTTLKLAPLLEDELMLQVPFAPTHDEEACKATGDAFAARAVDGETAHPFAALAALRKKPD